MLLKNLGLERYNLEFTEGKPCKIYFCHNLEINFLCSGKKVFI